MTTIIVTRAKPFPSADEGELDLDVYPETETCTVVVSFGKAVHWIAMPPAEARQLAALLVRLAEELSP